MKKIAVLAFFTLLAVVVSAQTQKDEERFAYVSEQLGLSKDLEAKLKPVFYEYRKELREAKDIYDNLKDKYITAIKKERITASQANALNNARWESDAKVVEVRKAYTPKFARILTPQQVYYLFSYANDSKEKRQSKK